MMTTVPLQALRVGAQDSLVKGDIKGANVDALDSLDIGTKTSLRPIVTLSLRFNAGHSGQSELARV